MNDREWAIIQEQLKALHDKQDRLNEKLSEVYKEMTTLKVKVAVFSSLIGSAATFLINKIF